MAGTWLSVEYSNCCWGKGYANFVRDQIAFIPIEEEAFSFTIAGRSNRNSNPVLILLRGSERRSASMFGDGSSGGPEELWYPALRGYKSCVSVTLLQALFLSRELRIRVRSTTTSILFSFIHPLHKRTALALQPFEGCPRRRLCVFELRPTALGASELNHLVRSSSIICFLPIS